MRSAGALLSGGVDSAPLALHLWNDPGLDEVHFLAVNYGQRHRKELGFAERTAERLGGPFAIVDLSGLQQLLLGSALTSPDIPVPEGHYTAESMKGTVVPNRNMIMLAIAAGYAVSRKLDAVVTAVHA